MQEKFVVRRDEDQSTFGIKFTPSRLELLIGGPRKFKPQMKEFLQLLKLQWPSNYYEDVQRTRAYIPCDRKTWVNVIEDTSRFGFKFESVTHFRRLMA